MPYLACDIHSKLNPSKCYARKGTEVLVTGNYGGILTVIPTGEILGFHVFPEELTDYQPSEQLPAAPDPAPPPMPKAAGRKSKAASKPDSPNPQASLF